MTNKEALHVVAKTSINPDEIANAQNKVKEETTMKNSKALTFEINGTTYSTKDRTGNYFYKTINGQKVRIKEAEFVKALDEYGWEQEANAERQAREDKVEADAKQAEEAVAKKTKKKSKKNVAFTFEDADGIVTLTEKQVKFIRLLPNDDFYENGLDSALWIDVLCDTLAGEFNPMALGAMVSTLREKYLISVGVQKVNGKKCKFFGFTELGKRVARELGLN